MVVIDFEGDLLRFGLLIVVVLVVRLKCLILYYGLGCLVSVLLLRLVSWFGLSGLCTR